MEGVRGRTASRLGFSGYSSGRYEDGGKLATKLAGRRGCWLEKEVK